MKKLCHLLWLGMLLVLVSVTTHAQTNTPDQEYKNLIKVDQDIQPLGAHPFGEDISLYDGTLSFEETDVSLPGNGPTIALSRSLHTTDSLGYGLNAQLSFGDWDLNIPRIETATANQTNDVVGWEVQAANPLDRCSQFGPPPDVPGNTIYGPDTWGPNEWWYGYHLIVPGQGSQDLLPRSAQNGLSPTISGLSFPIVTKQNWMIACGVTADDGGEGFLAIAPDGTRYTFAHLAYRPMTYITTPAGTTPDDVKVGAASTRGIHPDISGGGTSDVLGRRDGFMYVTQVQDRFGNTLTYHYDPTSGYLTSITANDGREVDLTYVPGTPLVHTVTAQAADTTPRTWTYIYDTTTNPVLPTLTGLTLPDGSAWSYQLASFHEAPIDVNGSNCNLNGVGTVINETLPTGTITTPSGLTGSFALAPILHGRSYVTQSCWGGVNPTDHVYFLIPNAYYQQSITSETITGAGLPTETWSYSYSPANQSWTTDTCAIAGTCPTTVWTDVVDPEGHDVRTTFSNRFDASEGELLETDYYTAGNTSAILRSEINTYANPTGGPWPAAYGVDLQGRDNMKKMTELSPLNQRTTTEEGDTYTWQALAFNEFGQANDVKRSNSITGQQAIEEKTSFLYDPVLWVLGLPEQVTNVTNNNEIESLNTYYPNDTLHTRARFGQTLMTYTWNSAGQLASFEDGDSNTTTLGNYYRGIPQSIGYPDTTTESLVVDDLGQISSITDQNGHTTGYTYDPVGRIASITYPTGDEVAWNSTTFQYNFASAERGIAAGHWDRTTTTGSAVTTTYFDAMLRPVLSDTSIPGTDISTGTAYDSKGQPTFTSYPVSGAASLTALLADPGTHHQYDALERVTQVQQDSELGALTSSTIYLSGAGEQVTDPKSNVTTTYYQVFDEPSYSAPIQVQAPNGVTQAINRDVYGNPLSITQSGLYNGTENDSVTKNLYYDSYHRLCLTTEPESGSEAMGYDGANNKAWSATGLSLTGACATAGQIAPTAMTQYTYYPTNKVHTIVPPAGTQSTSYIYDAVGNLKQATSGLTVWNGTYNFRNMPMTETLSVVGQSTVSLGYSHDANGHLAAVAYPGGGSNGGNQAIVYGPDALGRPTEVGSYASGITYWPNGQVAGFTYGNGTVYAASQNERQLLSNFSYTAGTTAQLSEGMVYDADANIKTVTDPTGLRSKSFGYDGLNRLTSAVAPQLSINESYTYDALNNLRSRVTGGQTLTYNYNPLWQLGTITNGANTIDTFGYDNDGNQTSKNGNTLQFDQKDQLIQIPNVDSYAYDASGRRVLKTPVGGSPTASFYDQGGQLMFELTPGTAQATNFIYLGTRLIARNAYTQLNAPGAVTFSNNPSNGNYTVSWGAVPGATTYTLQESFNGGAWATTNVSGTSYAFTNRNGGSYVYQVQACSGGSCGPWTTSATLEVTPALPTVTVPTSLTFAPFTVSWTAPVSATSYTVQQSFNGGAWTTIASAITTASFSVTSAPGGTYTFQVSASNAYGASGWAVSAPVSVTQIPATPTNFVVTRTGSGNVLTWDAMPWATSYGITEFGGGINLGEYLYNATTNSWSGPAPPDGPNNTYQLVACSIAGCSAYVSSAKTFVIKGATGASPINDLIQKVKRAVGDDTSSGSGCTATACTVTLGGNP